MTNSCKLFSEEALFRPVESLVATKRQVFVKKGENITLSCDGVGLVLERMSGSIGFQWLRVNSSAPNNR